MADEINRLGNNTRIYQLKKHGFFIDLNPNRNLVDTII